MNIKFDAVFMISVKAGLLAVASVIMLTLGPKTYEEKHTVGVDNNTEYTITEKYNSEISRYNLINLISIFTLWIGFVISTCHVVLVFLNCLGDGEYKLKDGEISVNTDKSL